MSPLDRIHAIVLTGGGPMALGATAGVVRFLEEQSIGYDWGVPNVRMPIVVGAAIDDLAIGDGRIRVGAGRSVSRVSIGRDDNRRSRAASAPARARRLASCSSAAAWPG